MTCQNGHSTMAILFWLITFLFIAFPNDAIDNGLSLEMPIRVVLALPDDNPALFDVSALSRSLSSLKKHPVPFFTGEMYEDSFLSFDLKWQVSELPELSLIELENRMKSWVTKQDDNDMNQQDAKSFHDIAVDVSVVDDFLNEIVDQFYPDETVIFILAPRKAKLFGETRRRRHYHYKSGSDKGLGLDCISTWVGRGKFLVSDLAAGPCTWGTEAQVSGPLMPYVGDGTQGPTSLAEALGLNSLVSISENSVEEGGEVEGGEEEEEDETIEQTDAFDESLSRMLLCSQVTSLLHKAVKYLLCPALGRESEPLAAYPTSARHLAVLPAHLLVPIVVMSPHVLPPGMSESAFLDSVVSVSQVQSILKDILPFAHWSHHTLNKSQVTVIAALHSMSDHPEISTAVASSLRFHTIHREQGVDVEEIPCVDPQVLHGSMYESHSGLTAALLSDSGLLNDAFGDVLSEMTDEGISGKEVVLPVIILSDVATHHIDNIEHITGFGKHQLLSTSFGDRAVIALHSAQSKVSLSSPLIHLVSGSHGGKDTTGVGVGRIWLDATDATAHVIAAILASLTGIASPPLDASLTPKKLHQGVGVVSRAEYSDFSWAVGYHPFMPFSLGKVKDDHSKSRKSSDDVLHVSPIYKDIALRSAIAANIRLIQEEIELFESLIFEFEDIVSKGMTSPWLVDRFNHYEKPLFEAREGDDAEMGATPLMSKLSPNTVGMKRRSLRDLLEDSHKVEEGSIPHFVIDSIDAARSSHSGLKLKLHQLPHQMTEAYHGSGLTQVLALVSETYAITKQARVTYTLGDRVPAHIIQRQESSQEVFGLDKALGIWKECCSIEFKVVAPHHNKVLYITLISVVGTMVLVGLLAWCLHKWSRSNRHAKKVGTSHYVKRTGGTSRF